MSEERPKDQQLWFNNNLHMAHISNRWMEHGVKYGYTTIEGTSYQVKYNSTIDAWELVPTLAEPDRDEMDFFHNQGYAGT